MKEFLEKVPKLADLTKAMYKGEEVAVMCYDPDNKIYAIHYGGARSTWVDEADLKFLTHWDASEFHQFFMKHPMEECIAYARGNGSPMQQIQSICRKGLVSTTGTVWAFEDIDGIETMSLSGRVECVKEVVG